MTADETSQGIFEHSSYDGLQRMFAISGIVAPILFAGLIIVLCCSCPFGVV